MLFAFVRLVSAPTQIRLKNASGMGQQADESGRASVWVGALGRIFCPRRPKRTQADEMGRPIEVALTNSIYKEKLVSLPPCVSQFRPCPRKEALLSKILRPCQDSPEKWRMFLSPNWINNNRKSHVIAFFDIPRICAVSLLGIKFFSFGNNTISDLNEISIFRNFIMDFEISN